MLASGSVFTRRPPRRFASSSPMAARDSTSCFQDRRHFDMARALRHMCRVAAICLITTGLVSAVVGGSGPRFYPDDPLQREPESQDASGAKSWDIDLFWDLSSNMFGRLGDQTPDVRAQDVNTIDEVPDSSWFTNRLLARP